MLIVYNEAHPRHQGSVEMFRGALVPSVEVPARVERVREELLRRGTGRFVAPGATDMALLSRVHDPRYLAFLRQAWNEWVALDPVNAGSDVLPSYWPIKAFRRDVEPQSFVARLGLYAFDAGTPLTAGSWDASREGANCAITAARQVLAGESAAFALTRPPGHHAGRDYFGGYCFLNNAALAAQALRDGGAQRVAILDIDYHHGNGTQTIFYDRSDVLFVSLHADPYTDYPYYIGYADEAGSGPGRGFNFNLPLPRGTDGPCWRQAFQAAATRIRAFRADALVVSLGVDTYERDPISGFRLTTADFSRIGGALAGLALPTVLVFEGGYAVEDIGVNTANVLDGFLQR
ncbi:MAG: histone deacetylase family protein [Burkholderiaceae bacterium]